MKSKSMASSTHIPLTFLSLPIPIIELVIWYLPTCDLISLSQCNSSLNYYCNARLYQSILITENNLIELKSASFKVGLYTILKKKKLSVFINSLANNRGLISYINCVTIMTSSSLATSNLTNDYDSLYYLFLSNYSNLKYLENLDYNNVKKCENFLQFNNNFISKKNLRKSLLYENDDLAINPTGMLTKILNLENYQISSMGDFKLIPAEGSKFFKLSIMIEQVYNERIDIDDFQLNDSLLKKFQWLRTLELNSSISSEIFLSKLENLKTNQIKFHNLETLSMTYIHSIRSQFDLLLDLENLSKIFLFSRLKNLELKLNCDDINCQTCIESFMNRLIPRLTNLIRLSIVYITNENLLANSRIDFDHNTDDQDNYKPLWSRTIASLNQLKKLNYLYLNLNDFTFIPFLKINDHHITSNSINIFNFNISHSFLEKKLNNFEELCHLSLTCLILPDFFYNWKLFKNDAGEVEDNLQFLSYLNKCDCEECHEARYLFKIYSESYEFVDNNVLLCTLPNSSPRYFKFPIKSKRLTMTDVKNYRFFYNSFIRNLKQRLPYTDKIFKNQSGLTILDKPFNEISLLGSNGDEYNDKKLHYDKFISLIVHNLSEDLKYFLQCNKQLKKLVLGGLFFEIEQVSTVQYICKGVYDDFSIIIDL